LYSMVMTCPGRMTRNWDDCERARASLATDSEYFLPMRSCTGWASQAAEGTLLDAAPASPAAGASDEARCVPDVAQAVRPATRKTGISLRIMEAPSDRTDIHDRPAGPPIRSPGRTGGALAGAGRQRQRLGRRAAQPRHVAP